MSMHNRSIGAPLENLLTGLDKVCQTGPGRWMACCPAHPDKTPSLNIREKEDGRVLVHCFAGCSVADVLAAVGLTFSDLFPPRPIDHHCPPERCPFNALDVLKCLSLETTVVLLAAHDMLEAGDLVLGKEGFDRLALAADRIQSALSLVGGVRHG